MAIGPRISLASSNADRQSAVFGAPLTNGALADISLPVGFLATVTGLGQQFEGDGLSFSLAPVSDPLPAGLSFDENAVIFGTPTEAATRTIVIRATNTSGFMDSAVQLETFDLAFSATIDGLSDNPSFGPSAQTGVPLTAAAVGFNGPPPGPVSFQWSTLESGPIAGATSASYTPNANQRDGETLLCTISSSPYPATQTAAAVIRRVPPVAAMALQDDIFDIDTGLQTIDASVDFTGEALTYEVSGQQANIDAAGLVTIDTSVALAGEEIVVTASNSGGSATSRFLITIEDPDAPVFQTTLTTTTAPVRGVTFTFDRPMPVGYSVNGDPIVIADQTFLIIDDSPTSEVGINYVGSGMMEFAGDGSDAPASSAAAQGFDASLDSSGANPGSLGSGSAIDFDPTLNIAPSRTGNGPITVPQGARKTFVKARRGSENATGSIAEYVVLTVLPEAPATPVPFRPGAVYANQALFGEADIDLSCLRTLTPPANIPSAATALDNLSYTAASRMFPEWKPNRQRRIEDTTTRNLPGTQAYSADYAVARSYALYLLHSNTVGQVDKLAMARRIIQFGLDVIAAYQAGSLFANGAGQWHGYHSFAYFAAFLLKDATLLSGAQAIQSNMQSMPLWVNDDLTGSSGQWPSGNIGGKNWFGRTYDETDIGKPDWNGSGGRKGSEVPADSGYKSIALPIGTQELLPLLLLQDGPGGISGYDAFLQAEGGNGRYDTSNPRAAAIAIMGRWPTWRNPERGWNSAYRMRDFHDAWMPNIYGQTTALGGDTITRWSGVPDATEEPVITGAGVGSITYSYAGKQQTTEPVTRYDLAWSLDNIQFLEDLDVGVSGTKSNLLRGTLHHAKMRLVSASGVGKWTRTGHRIATQNSGNEGEVTTVGSQAAAAPVFTTDPALYRLTYPGQQEPLYTLAEASLPNETRTLFCGVGYSSGYPAPTYSFDWKKDGVSIGAPDQNFYDIDPANDQGAIITCTITSSNASGSDVHTTSGVAVATGATPAAGVIFDSSFDSSFFLDWPYEFQNFSSSNTNGPSWNPYTRYDSGEIGNIRGGKSGSNPSLRVDMDRSLVDGTTYVVTVSVLKGAGDPQNDNGNSFRFRLRGLSSSTNIQFEAFETVSNLTVQEVLTFSYTFTASNPVPATIFEARWVTSNGGGTGGDVELVGLSIVES